MKCLYSSGKQNKVISKTRQSAKTAVFFEYLWKGRRESVVSDGMELLGRMNDILDNIECMLDKTPN